MISSRGVYNSESLHVEDKHLYDENNYDLETALVEGAKAVLAHQKGELDLPDVRDFLNSL